MTKKTRYRRPFPKGEASFCFVFSFFCHKFVFFIYFFRSEPPRQRFFKNVLCVFFPRVSFVEPVRLCPSRPKKRKRTKFSPPAQKKKNKMRRQIVFRRRRFASVVFKTTVARHSIRFFFLFFGRRSEIFILSVDVEWPGKSVKFFCLFVLFCFVCFVLLLPGSSSAVPGLTGFVGTVGRCWPPQKKKATRKNKTKEKRRRGTPISTESQVPIDFLLMKRRTVNSQPYDCNVVTNSTSFEGLKTKQENGKPRKGRRKETK